MEWNTVLAGGLLAVFMGSTIQASAGLGYSLVGVPIAVYFMPPQVAIPALLVLGSLVNGITLIETRRSVEVSRFLPAGLLAAVITPAGAVVLAIADVDRFRLFAGLVIVALGLALLFGFQWQPRRRWLAVSMVGLGSGILQGSLAMGGPPMAIFMGGQQVDKQTFRGNMFAFLTLIDIAALTSFSITGLLTREVLKTSLFLAPAMVIGCGVGVLVARRLNEVLFRRVIFSLVIAGGTSSVLAGLGAI